MTIPWMWDVACWDALAALTFLVIGLKAPARQTVRYLVLAAAGWCTIEAVGHAWLENTVAGVLG